MLRSLFIALALLAALPAMAQNTVTFSYGTQAGEPAAAGLTALIYSDDPDQAPIEGVVGADGRLVVQDLPMGTYYPYLEDNDQAYVVYLFEAEVDSNTGEFNGSAVVDAVSPAQGLVRGRITIADSGEPIRNAKILLQGIGVVDPFFLASIDGDGRFTIQLQPGSYSGELILFFDTDGVIYRNPEVDFSISAGETLPLDVVTEAFETGFITGRATDAETGAPLVDVFVAAYATDGSWGPIVRTNALGEYAIEAIVNPEYVVTIDAGTDYVNQYYDGVFFPSQATTIAVESNQTVGNIDFALSSPADDFSVSVQATVVGTDGAPLDGEAEISVRALNNFDVSVPVVDGVLDFTTDNAIFAGAPFIVSFSAPGFESEFFDDSPTEVGAQAFFTGPDAVSFDLGEVVLLADGELAQGLAISGTVSQEEGGAPLAGAIVTAQRLDAPGIRYAVTDAAGAYRIAGLDAGEYVVLFTETDHIPEFFPDAATWTEAERIALTSDRGAVNGLMGGLNRPVGANVPPPASSGSGAPFVQVGGTVSGTIRDADGAVVMGTVVTATGLNGVEAYALTDGLGQFSLDVVSEAVTVTADRGRYDSESRPVNASDSSPMLVTLSPSSAVSSEGAPSEGVSAVRVYPNPVRGRATVALALGTPGPAEVAVYDMLGRSVWTARASSGDAELSLDAARLAPGRYVVRVLTVSDAVAIPMTIVR